MYQCPKEQNGNTFFVFFFKSAFPLESGDHFLGLIGQMGLMPICKPVVRKENSLSLIELNYSGLALELRTELYFLQYRYMDKIGVPLAIRKEKIMRR